MINFIKEYFKSKKLKKEITAAKVENLEAEYNYLINELRLIQEKKSTLSKSKRDFVKLRIAHLIAKGHITVKPEN